MPTNVWAKAEPLPLPLHVHVHARTKQCGIFSHQEVTRADRAPFPGANCRQVHVIVIVTVATLLPPSSSSADPIAILMFLLSRRSAWLDNNNGEVALCTITSCCSCARCP